MIILCVLSCRYLLHYLLLHQINRKNQRHHIVTKIGKKISRETFKIQLNKEFNRIKWNEDRV